MHGHKNAQKLGKELGRVVFELRADGQTNRHIVAIAGTPPRGARRNKSNQWRD